MSNESIKGAVQKDGDAEKEAAENEKLAAEMKVERQAIDAMNLAEARIRTAKKADSSAEDAVAKAQNAVRKTIRG